MRIGAAGIAIASVLALSGTLGAQSVSTNIPATQVLPKNPTVVPLGKLVKWPPIGSPARQQQLLALDPGYKSEMLLGTFSLEKAGRLPFDLRASVKLVPAPGAVGFAMTQLRPGAKIVIKVSGLGGTIPYGYGSPLVECVIKSLQNTDAQWQRGMNAYAGEKLAFTYATAGKSGPGLWSFYSYIPATKLIGIDRMETTFLVNAVNLEAGKYPQLGECRLTWVVSKS